MLRTKGHDEGVPHTGHPSVGGGGEKDQRKEAENGQSPLGHTPSRQITVRALALGRKNATAEVLKKGRAGKDRSSEKKNGGGQKPRQRRRTGPERVKQGASPKA